MLHESIKTTPLPKIASVNEKVALCINYVNDGMIDPVKNMADVWIESDWLVFRVAKEYSLSEKREDTIMEADKILTEMILNDDNSELARRVKGFYFVVNLSPEALDIISSFDPKVNKNNI